MSNNDPDSEKLSFSQRGGYEKIPSPLKLEEISQEAQTCLWNNLYEAVRHSISRPYGYQYYITSPPWLNILRDLHAYFFKLELDSFNDDHEAFIRDYKHLIYNLEFNKVFDLLEYIMCHPECPPSFINDVAETFEECQLAYRVDKEQPVTIYPAATETEGKTILKARKQLRDDGFFGAEAHLQKAIDSINQREYADSVRQSINAVEAVAKKLDPKSSNSLDKMLKSLEEKNPLHPALKKGLQALYGYTSDEKGIRHPLIDEKQANVGMDEAVFMLGACAAFSSYLLRKYQS